MNVLFAGGWEANITKRIEAVRGDITKIPVDVIVNAANCSLLGGGGVDGAIHRAAGPDLLKECAALGGCKTGEARITRAYQLPAKFVIHTPGPVWRGGKHREDELLRNCYQNVLQLAVGHQAQTISFPAISTGVYHFPLERATGIAVNTVADFLMQDHTIQKLMFVCFNEQAYCCYQDVISRRYGAAKDK